MAPPADLRAWIALLEREGELVRVSAEVDPDLEITEINDRVVKAAGRRSCSRTSRARRTRC
jgi:UbiD family decarboxylase